MSGGRVRVVAARVVADVVVAVHMVFLVYMVLGGFLALRRFGLIWPHVGVIVYSFYVTLTSFTCPATTLEKWLLGLGGETPYEGSFIHQYLRGRLYPAELETAVWISCMAIAMASWAYVLMRRRRAALQREALPAA
jgi:hypothetical protein